MIVLARHQPIPVGGCIYCSSTDKALTLEHVIPAGLGGGHTIERASCEECRKVTQAFEQTALRHIIGPGRYKLNVPERGRGRRPTTWPVYKTLPDGSAARREIPIDEVPFYLAMPLFASGFAEGIPLPEGYDLSQQDDLFHIKEPEEQFVEKLRKHDADHVDPLFSTVPFAQMLAKIAHGFCIAAVGRENFTPLLIPIILGHSSYFYRQIASAHPTSKLFATADQPAYGYEIREMRLNGKIWVEINLVKSLPTPRYFVFAGMLGQSTFRASYPF